MGETQVALATQVDAQRPESDGEAEEWEDVPGEWKWGVKFCILLLVLLCGLGAGQSIGCACDAGWNPFTYYKMLSSVMQSPWSSEEIWIAAKEQRTVAMWSFAAAVTGAVSCYIGGPELACKTIHGVYAMYVGCRPSRHMARSASGWPPQTQFQTPYAARSVWAGSMDGSEGYFPLSQEQMQPRQFVAILDTGLKKLMYRQRNGLEAPKPIEID